MATIVFLHGLNTFGDDCLHIGPLKFGLMHERLERAFHKRDIDFIAVTRLGSGTPEEQADRALQFLDEVGLSDEAASLHLLGQSVGGLAARALAARPEMKGRVKTLTTIGTPHQGTETALFGLEFGNRYPWMRQIFSLLGYDTTAKEKIFRQFTPEATVEFNRTHPPFNDIREISLLCEVQKQDLSLPLLALHRHLHPPTLEGIARSDGFVLCESQKNGEEIGPFALDHFAQLGFFFHAGPAARRRAEREFNRLIDTFIGRVVSLGQSPVIAREL